MAVTANEMVVYVLRKLSLFFSPMEEDSWLVDIYDGSTWLKTFSSDSRDGARKLAVSWIGYNYDIPKSIERMEVR